ncbi:MAG: hypothetical protein JJE25_08490 [Bacteroidia bacterium]|nr:hypothetical protein [Bacteroidia bacterium]
MKTNLFNALNPFLQSKNFPTLAPVRNSRKIIAGLLAVHMLTLVLMPCNDSCDSQQHQTATIVQGAQEHHEQDNDICSPFCTCSCCSSLITLAYQTELKTFVPVAANAFSGFDKFFNSVFSADCWQPPRIA